MNYNFELLENTRLNLLKVIEGLTENQLHTIPEGFNNNIAWNFNHIIIVQQLLCYKLSGIALDLDKEMVLRYSKGGKPSNTIMEGDFNICKDIALSSVSKLKEDYEKGIFDVYHQYTTSYNVTLRNIKEAITFNNMHEGLHLGYILALKRAIK